MICVLIVDNTTLACSVTSYVLQKEKDIRVVGFATSLAAALAQVEGERCDIILANAALPDHGALRLIDRTSSHHETVKVVVTEVANSSEAVLPYIEAGAAGYVLKEASVEELLKTIRLVQKDAAVVSPKIAAALMDRLAQLAGVHIHTTRPWNSYTTLTQREREVLELVRRGWSNQEIATHLTLQVGTVKNHVHNILRKLDVRNRREAVAHITAIENNGLGTLIA